MRSIVQVRNLSKRYGRASVFPPTLKDSLRRFIKPRGADSRDKSGKNFWALEDVSFDVIQGEALGIIGRNGAGKSTLVKILSRIVKPTHGEVDIYGRLGSLLEIGMGFHPDLSGRDNIYLNGAIIGMKKGEVKSKFDEIVAFSEIEDFLETPIKYYSTGMYLRLAFSVAAHFEPEILILDEVLAVGDAAFQKKCLNKMKEINRAGRTVLFISHDLLSVQQMCERALLIEAGHLTAVGPAVQVVDTYLKRLAATEER